MDRRAITGLKEMKFAPSDHPGVAMMTLIDANGREGSYHLNQDSLTTLLNRVLGYTADRWIHEPERVEEDVCGIASASPGTVSLQPLDSRDRAVTFKLGDGEVAFLIPGD
jgi:hypothetical protein